MNKVISSQNLGSKVTILLFCIYALSIGCSSIMNKGVLKDKDFVEKVSFETIIGLAIVPVSINGETYRFLFDTGAPNVISEELQNKFKFKAIGKQSIRDSEGKSNSVKYILLSDLTIGEVTFLNTAAFVADLKANPAIECLNIDGIIGSNLMRFCTWRVDFTTEMITLTDLPQKLDYSSSYREIPFNTNTQHDVIIDFKTPNAKITNLKIDYGSNSSIGIPNRVYNVLSEKGDLSESRLEVGYSQSGLFGDLLIDTTVSSIIPYGNFGEFKIGKTEIESSGKGLLGTKILKNYLVTMNWETQKVGFENIKDSVDFQRNRFGFSPAFSKGNTIVKSVIVDGPAFQAGIEPGMVIHKINDVLVEGINGFCDYLLKEKTKQSSIIVEIEINQKLKTFELKAE